MKIKPFDVQFNIKFHFNEFEQMDGDGKGVFLCVDNDSTMKPIVKRNYAIPDYATYFDKEKAKQLIEWLKTCLKRM